mmetsp:Transcript_28516/g.49788  ORF Transcript_28516/g.49788 Transcript_28516/m.49788 type:complete len:236 (+) Transcript_28516:159-866(+)
MAVKLQPCDWSPDSTLSSPKKGRVKVIRPPLPSSLRREPSGAEMVTSPEAERTSEAAWMRWEASACTKVQYRMRRSVSSDADCTAEKLLKSVMTAAAAGWPFAVVSTPSLSLRMGRDRDAATSIAVQARMIANTTHMQQSHVNPFHGFVSVCVRCTFSACRIFALASSRTSSTACRAVNFASKALSCSRNHLKADICRSVRDIETSLSYISSGSRISSSGGSSGLISASTPAASS